MRPIKRSVILLVEVVGHVVIALAFAGTGMDATGSLLASAVGWGVAGCYSFAAFTDRALIPSPQIRRLALVHFLVLVGVPLTAGVAYSHVPMAVGELLVWVTCVLVPLGWVYETTNDVPVVTPFIDDGLRRTEVSP